MKRVVCMGIRCGNSLLVIARNCTGAAMSCSVDCVHACFIKYNIRPDFKSQDLVEIGPAQASQMCRDWSRISTAGCIVRQCVVIVSGSDARQRQGRTPQLKTHVLGQRQTSPGAAVVFLWSWRTDTGQDLYLFTYLLTESNILIFLFCHYQLTTLTFLHMALFTSHFSGPGRAIGLTVCVFACVSVQ